MTDRGLQDRLDEISSLLTEAVTAVYANTGPSPILVKIRAAQELIYQLGDEQAIARIKERGGGND